MTVLVVAEIPEGQLAGEFREPILGFQLDASPRPWKSGCFRGKPPIASPKGGLSAVWKKFECPKANAASFLVRSAALWHPSNRRYRSLR
jgi:hypothetical protein